MAGVVPYEVVAVVTNGAKQRLAEMMATGKSFMINQFALTDQGHDTLDPAVALTPDPTRETCMPNPPGGAPRFTDSIDSYSYTGTFCPEFTCRVDYGEAIGEISSICLIAQIVYSPTSGDPELGTTFLFAYANMPLWVKTALDAREWNVTLHF